MTEQQRDINTTQVVSFLNRAFANAAIEAMPKIGRKAVKSTKLYRYQVNFCYLVDEIERGPKYIVPKRIQEANNLITQLEQER